MSVGFLHDDLGAKHAFEEFAKDVARETNGIRLVVKKADLGSTIIECFFRKCGHTEACYACSDASKPIGTNMKTCDANKLDSGFIHGLAEKHHFRNGNLNGMSLILTLPFSLQTSGGLWLEQIEKDVTNVQLLWMISLSRQSGPDCRFRRIGPDSWQCNKSTYAKGVFPSVYTIKEAPYDLTCFSLIPSSSSWLDEVAKCYIKPTEPIKDKTIEEAAAEFGKSIAMVIKRNAELIKAYTKDMASKGCTWAECDFNFDWKIGQHYDVILRVAFYKTDNKRQGPEYVMQLDRVLCPGRTKDLLANKLEKAFQQVYLDALHAELPFSGAKEMGVWRWVKE